VFVNSDTYFATHFKEEEASEIYSVRTFYSRCSSITPLHVCNSV